VPKCNSAFVEVLQCKQCVAGSNSKPIASIWGQSVGVVHALLGGTARLVRSVLQWICKWEQDRTEVTFAVLFIKLVCETRHALVVKAVLCEHSLWSLEG
jgi:hypothetical protein